MKLVNKNICVKSLCALALLFGFGQLALSAVAEKCERPQAIELSTENCQALKLQGVEDFYSLRESISELPIELRDEIFKRVDIDPRLMENSSVQLTKSDRAPLVCRNVPVASPCGKFIVARERDTDFVFDAETLRQVRQHTKRDSDQLLYGRSRVNYEGETGHVFVFDAKTSKRVYLTKGDGTPLVCIGFVLRCGRFIVACEKDTRHGVIFDAKTFRVVGQLTKIDGTSLKCASSFRVSSCGDFIVACETVTSYMFLFDAKTLCEVGYLTEIDETPFKFLSYPFMSPCGNFIVALNRVTRHEVIFDVETLREVGKLTKIDGTLFKFLYPPFMSPCGNFIVAYEKDTCHGVFFDAKTFREVGQLAKIDGTPLKCASFLRMSSCGNFIVACERDTNHVFVFCTSKGILHAMRYLTLDQRLFLQLLWDVRDRWESDYPGQEFSTSTKALARAVLGRRRDLEQFKNIYRWIDHMFESTEQVRVLGNLTLRELLKRTYNYQSLEEARLKEQAYLAEQACRKQARLEGQARLAFRKKVRIAAMVAVVAGVTYVKRDTVKQLLGVVRDAAKHLYNSAPSKKAVVSSVKTGWSAVSSGRVRNFFSWS